MTRAFTVSCCFVGPLNRCYRGICFADPSDSRIICFADLPTSEPRTNYQVLLDSKDCALISRAGFKHVELAWPWCCCLCDAACTPTIDHSIDKMNRLRGGLYMNDQCRRKVDTVMCGASTCSRSNNTMLCNPATLRATGDKRGNLWVGRQSGALGGGEKNDGGERSALSFSSLPTIGINLLRKKPILGVLYCVTERRNEIIRPGGIWSQHWNILCYPGRG